MWYFFVFSPGSRSPFQLFLKQDKRFLKQTADSNLQFNDFVRYGQRQKLMYQLLESSQLKRFFSPSCLLQQKAMMIIEKDIVEGHSSDRSGMVAVCFVLVWFFVKVASERAAFRTGNKMLRIHLWSANEKIRIFWCAFSELLHTLRRWFTKLFLGIKDFRFKFRERNCFILLSNTGLPRKI